jgi:hypothetical protein
MSENEKFLSLHNFFNSEQSKYIYFLLVASISSIAFWINKTSNMHLKLIDLKLNEYLLFSSVVFWILSIIFGLTNRKYILSIAYSNMDALLYLNGEHPKSYKSPYVNIEADKTIMDIIKKSSKKAERYFKMQFVFFCIGVITFSIWHIINIFI